jgi:hypothetical protein
MNNPGGGRVEDSAAQGATRGRLPTPTIASVKIAVAAEFHITAAELTGNSREAKFAHPHSRR